jgi:D-alanyl-D-alanine dipeptidase
VKLEPSVHLDVRYATANNFVGRPVYTQARAFLQRPAAEALQRAAHALAGQGYGLLVFDGYRPWRVTKLFWDITPADKKQFVADPTAGLAAQPRLRRGPVALRPRDRQGGRDDRRL